jgi:hypothetical protein
MKLLGRIALGVLGLLVVLAIVGALLPRQWRVEARITIHAPPDRIHPFLDDLRKWPEWAVWNKDMDPKVVWTYAGPDRGVGSRWAWNGPVMGKGRMEIVESDPAVGLTVDEAIESETVNARAKLRYAVAGADTTVTWVDEGTLPPVIGGYFRGMIEDMLKDNFGKGLAKLKAVVEALPPPPPPAPVVEDAGTDVPDAVAEADDAGAP